MIYKSKLLLVFLIVILMNGCEKKEKQSAKAQTVDDVFITESSEIHKEYGYEKIVQEEIIRDESTDEEKVRITLKVDPSIYDKIVYIDRNVTTLQFFKCAIIGIEGLGQLTLLDTIVINKAVGLEDLSFLTDVPHLRRLFIHDSLEYNIDWSFIEQLSDLEVLSVHNFWQSTINIDLKNNKHFEYIEFTGLNIETFPVLFNVPNSLKYLNLQSNKITILPSDIDKYNHTTVILGVNPFEKDATTPSNITVEYDWKILGETYSIPTGIPYISGLD